MNTYTPQQLTELAEQKPDELVRMIAEVCYGWKHRKGQVYADAYTDGSNYVIDVEDFNPLAKTEAGISQAFELAEKFQIGTSFHDNGCWSAHDNTGDMLVDEMPDLQTAICIAAYLTAQEIKR